MTHGVRVWLSSLALGLLGLAACIDLTPDVGKLQTGSTGDPAEPNSGGDNGQGSNEAANSTGNGSGAGNDPADDGGATANGGGNTGASEGGNANVGANGDSDAAMPANDAGNGCAIKDSNPADDVSFASDVWMILEGCRCHNSSDADPFGILESGLTIDGYASLRKGGDNTHASIIVDNDPCKSLILDKLSEAPSFGERMPYEGPYLSEAQRQLISDWIVEGARDN